MKFYTNVSRYGNNILLREYDNGVGANRKVKFAPTFYIPSEAETGYTSFIDKRSVEPRQFDTISQAKSFIETYKDTHGFPIYGTTNYITQYIQETYPGRIDYDMGAMKILLFDIEVDISTGYPNVDAADKEVTSISMKFLNEDDYYILGRKDYDRYQTTVNIDPEKIHFRKFNTEKELLKEFIRIWSQNYPDVVSGWNCVLFDISYIVTRISNVLGENTVKQLSPWGIINRKTVNLYNKDHQTYNIVGISIIDYLDIFKKFAYKYGTQENYKLDTIAHTVLGEKKLDYTEYKSLTELYNRNPQLYLDYNLKDTYLVQRIEEETGLLSLVLTVAYKGGVNYEDTLGTVAIWESRLYRALMDKNIIPPIKRATDKDLQGLVGGYVKDPQVGKHRWVVSFDLNSLYPHLMMQYNMSPETYIGKTESVSVDMVLNGDYQNNNPDISVAANGVAFSNKSLGIIPEIIKGDYAERKVVKTRMLELESNLQGIDKNTPEWGRLNSDITQCYNQQMAIKILMNSLYGAVANKYFIYFIEEMAEAITTSGQLSLRYAHDAVNGYMKGLFGDMDYVVYCDTDSIYLNMEPLITATFKTPDIDRYKGERFLDEVCKKKVEPIIEACYEDLANRMGAYTNAMKMKREKITDNSIFIAKKRYIMSALNSEGIHYKEPKISMTGIEAVRASVPQVCRDKMKELFKTILGGTEKDTQEFIRQFKVEFKKLPIEDIAKISGTNDIEKYQDANRLYKKGCPIHVRGCILYNYYITNLGLDSKYELIRSGDKIKFVYLQMPNIIKEDIISFPNNFPDELNLRDFIDYDKQFDKTFLNPIELILDCIGWNGKAKSTLESFFGN